MNADLENYAGTFDNVTRIGEGIVLRFHNGYRFDLASDNPVVLIRANRCENIDAVEAALVGLAGENIDGLSVAHADRWTRISIEFCFREPYVVAVAEVSVSYEQYTLEDQRKYIRSLEESWRRDRVTHQRLLSNIKQLREHLQEEVVRLRKKADFFSGRSEKKAASCTVRLAALVEVLKQLQTCEPGAAPAGATESP